MPGLSQDDKDKFSTFKCVSSNQCSKVTCVGASADHILTVGFEVNKCRQPLSGNVTLKQPDMLDWSHSLGDGEKAKLPVVPGAFTGQLQVFNASLFIKVGLQEMKGNKVNFTVRKPHGLMQKCAVPENIHTPLIEGFGIFCRVGVLLEQRIQRNV